MTRDEIQIIASIVGGDDTYAHFVHRINKEFENSDIERNSKVHVILAADNIGFAVIGYSPVKMSLWEKVFIEEEWVKPDFKIDYENSYELMYMYIRPEYRGVGNGNKLFDQIVNFSHKNSIKDIYAYVSDRDNKAFNFYLKKGAQVIEDLSDEDVTTAFLQWRFDNK